MSDIARVLLVIATAGASGASLAMPDHLAAPLAYDNAGNTFPWGQTFMAEEASFFGISWYIGDPSRPGDASVDALTGDASLVLFRVDSPSSLTELARRQVQSGSDSSFGLTTFSLSFPVPTVVGQKYFAALETSDRYGLGLRGFSSTYTGGSEAYIWIHGFEELGGRDTSFAVTAVPEPATYTLLGAGIAFVLALVTQIRRLRTRTGA